MPSTDLRQPTEQRQLEAVTSRLREQFPDLPAVQVHDAVARAVRTFEPARLRQFVPLLVERDAKADCRRRRVGTDLGG